MMKKALLAIWASFVIGMPALAHEPVIPLLQCWPEAAADVACEARWSTGVAMSGVRYEVTNTQDQTFLSGRTDQQGLLRFTPPADSFHVLLWSAGGLLAEAGSQDLKRDGRRY